ncbi:MAG: hypothetical protein PHC34_10570 [Candidatus Gastranaerophilales bacterium]|nr:hypothetical protein [Candidatus Gastranaerophilales bacterium]
MINPGKLYTGYSNIYRSKTNYNNATTCAGYLKRPDINNNTIISFQGISPIKKFFAPKYIDPVDIPKLVDNFTDRVIFLHTSQTLTLKSLKKLIKQVVPDHRIFFDKVPERIKFLIGKLGMTDSGKTFGIRYSKMYISYDIFKGSDLFKNLEDINILAHEFTHALQFHTKDFQQYKAFDTKFGLSRQLLNNVNKSVENSIFADDFMDKWRNSNEYGLFNNVIDDIFKDHNINDKQDKINIVKFQYSKIKLESQAYHYGNKSMSKLVNIPLIVDDVTLMLKNLSVYIKQSLEKQGIDTADLLFKDLKNL